MISRMVGRLVSPITIGRRAELEAGAPALDAAIDGSPTNLLIAGRGGRRQEPARRRARDRRRGPAGSSCCAARARTSATRGCRTGRSSRSSARWYATSTRQASRRSSARPAPDLARLVPALDPASSAAPVQQRVAPDPPVRGAHRPAAPAAAISSPVLIVVEDVHWADPATRETLDVPRPQPAHRARRCIAMTLRSDELHRRHPALPWLAELERTGRVQRIDLARLDVDETAAMLEAITGEPVDPEAAIADPPAIRRQPVLHRGAADRRDRARVGAPAHDAARDPPRAPRGAGRERPRGRRHRRRHRTPHRP